MGIGEWKDEGMDRWTGEWMNRLGYFMGWAPAGEVAVGEILGC